MLSLQTLELALRDAGRLREASYNGLLLFLVVILALMLGCDLGSLVSACILPAALERDWRKCILLFFRKSLIHAGLTVFAYFLGHSLIFSQGSGGGSLIDGLILWWNIEPVCSVTVWFNPQKKVYPLPHRRREAEPCLKFELGNTPSGHLSLSYSNLGKKTSDTQRFKSFRGCFYHDTRLTHQLCWLTFFRNGKCKSSYLCRFVFH